VRVDGPSVTPSIPYEAPCVALGWLTDVLGFTLSDAFHDPAGNLAFAQLVWGNGAIFISGARPRTIRGRVLALAPFRSLLTTKLQ